MAHRYMKMCSISLIIGKMQIKKATIRYHLTPVRMAVIKRERERDNKCGKDVEKREPLTIGGGNVNWCTMENRREDSSRN